MDLKDLMDGFVANIGLDGIEPDANGAYALSFDGMDVGFKEDEPGMLLLVAPFAKRPSEGSDRLAEVLLTANHLLAATGGATVSLDPASDEYFLQKRDRLSALDLEGFSQTVEAFVNKVEEMQKMVLEFRPVFERAAEAAAEERAEISGFGTSGFMQV